MQEEQSDITYISTIFTIYFHWFLDVGEHTQTNFKLLFKKRIWFIQKTMNGNKNIRQVPWSRHMVVFPKEPEQHNCNAVTRARSNLRQIKADVAAGQKKTLSDTILWLGDNLFDEFDESWDSQSDPGSTSVRNDDKINRPTISMDVLDKDHRSESEGSNDDDVNQIEMKLKHPVQGRDALNNQLRQRKGANIEEATRDFVMEIPEESLPCAEVISTKYNRLNLNFYFDFMYYSCVSSYKWDKKEVYELTKRQYALSIIQKVG